jgi:hypothetical protein
MGISFSKVGFEEKIVWCGKSSLKFIKEAIMPYYVKGLLDVQKGGCAQFLFFEAFEDLVYYSLTLLHSRVFRPETELVRGG